MSSHDPLVPGFPNSHPVPAIAQPVSVKQAWNAIHNPGEDKTGP